MEISGNVVRKQIGNGVMVATGGKGGDWRFCDVVALVVEMEPEGVFLNIVGFL